MANIRLIRRRIKGIQSTAKITRAMEMIATSKMRRAQERGLAGRPYAEKIQQVMADLAALRRVLLVALPVSFLVLGGLVFALMAGMRDPAPRAENNQEVAEVDIVELRPQTARLDLALQGYDREAARQLVGTLRDEARALPGVTAVGFAVDVPLNLSSRQRGAVPEGFVVEEGINPPSIDYNYVDEGYFEAMGIPLLRGRAFGRTDGPDAEPVLVEDLQAAAHQDVVIGLVAGRAAQRVDARALGDVDPDLGHEHALEIQTRDNHGVLLSVSSGTDLTRS